MQNKLLSITRNIVPYIKELRPLAGSITAVILWQQLDYWFARSPDSFYKFLSPPKTNHEKYRIGDSWTEELGFSEFEFRTAFDKIGVRHTSKGAFNAAENPFSKNDHEYYFCSYHDKMKGITYYFRNHELADKALDSLVHTQDSPVTKEPSVTETNNLQLQNPSIPSSTIYTETTSENNHNTQRQELKKETNIVVEDEKINQVFTQDQHTAAKKVLAEIPLEKQHQVLTLLTVIFKETLIKSPIGYLVGVVKNVKNGTFIPVSSPSTSSKPAKSKVPEIWERLGFNSLEEYGQHSFNQQMATMKA